MKVTEIISQDLNEGIGTSILSKLFGGAAKAGAYIVGKGSKAQAIEAAAEYIAKGGKIKNAKQLASVVGDSTHATKDVLAAAQKKAATLVRNAKFTKDVAAITATASKAARITKTIASLGMSTYYYALLWEPLSLYLDNMKTAEEYLAAGKVPDGTPDGTTPQEWFDAYRQSQMSQLIGKWAVVWAGGKLAKMPFGAASKLVGGLSPKLGSAMSGLGRVGQLAMMSWLSSPENSKTVAEFMAGPLVSGIVGGAGVEATDAIKNAIGMASAKDSAAPNANEPTHSSQGASNTEPGGDDKPSNSADTDKATNATKLDPAWTNVLTAMQKANPNKSEADLRDILAYHKSRYPEDDAQDALATLNKPNLLTPKEKKAALENPANWVYSSQGMVKNKVTGDIDYATNHK